MLSSDERKVNFSPSPPVFGTAFTVRETLSPSPIVTSFRLISGTAISLNLKFPPRLFCADINSYTFESYCAVTSASFGIAALDMSSSGFSILICLIPDFSKAFMPISPTVAGSSTLFRNLHL